MEIKPVHWVGNARSDLKAMPESVQETFGYALHCFQKKSKSGIATPKFEIDLIQSRLKLAEAHARSHTS